MWGVCVPVPALTQKNKFFITCKTKQTESSSNIFHALYYFFQCESYIFPWLKVMVNICLARICGTLQEREKNILRGVIIYITHVCSVAKLYFRILCQASRQNPPDVERIQPKGGNLPRVCLLGCAYHVLTTQQKDTWVHMCLVVCPGFQMKVIWIIRQLRMAKCLELTVPAAETRPKSAQTETSKSPLSQIC